MPRKPLDDSTSFSLSMKRPWREVPQTEIDDFCREFEIEDRKGFEEDFLPIVSAVYRMNRVIAGHGAPAPSEMRRLLKDITTKTKRLNSAICKVGPATKIHLERVDLNQPKFEPLAAEITSLITNNALAPIHEGQLAHFIDSYNAATHTLDLHYFLSMLDVFQVHLEILCDESLTDLRPPPDQSREHLMSSIFDLWERERRKPVSRYFDQFKKDKSSSSITPGNTSTNFCVALARIIDDKLTNTILDKMIMAEITARKTGKRNTTLKIAYK